MLLSYYTVSSGNCLPVFWDILSVPSSRAKNDCLGNESGNYGVVETVYVHNRYYFWSC